MTVAYGGLFQPWEPWNFPGLHQKIYGVFRQCSQPTPQANQPVRKLVMVHQTVKNGDVIMIVSD